MPLALHHYRPIRAGFKPDRALFGKNVGAPPSHKFSDINVQKHSVDTCELDAILLLLSELSGDTAFCIRPTISGYRAPFCGAPVRPNMLNIPKSASEAYRPCFNQNQSPLQALQGGPKWHHFCTP